MFESLYLVYPTIDKNNSATVRQIEQLGVANISIAIAKQKQEFAGRLRLFKSNWDKICSDQWVLQAIRGYHIEWLHRPYQGERLHCPRFSQGEGVSTIRNKPNVKKAGDFSSGSPLRVAGLPVKHLSGAQKGRGSQTHHQLEEVERFYSPYSLQNGGYPHAKGPVTTGGFYGEDRPEGRVLCSSTAYLLGCHVLLGFLPR